MISNNEAREWLENGKNCFKAGDNQEAIRCFEKALELVPDDATLWNNKGLAISKTGRHEDAIACYDRALEIDPGHKIAWCNRGFSYQARGMYEEALKCFRKALKIDPQFQAALTNQSICLGLLARARKSRNRERGDATRCTEKIEKARTGKPGTTVRPEKPEPTNIRQAEPGLEFEQIFPSTQGQNQTEGGHRDGAPGNNEPAGKEESHEESRDPFPFEKVDGSSIDMFTLPEGIYLLQDKSGNTQERNWNPESKGSSILWKGYARAKWKLKAMAALSSGDDAAGINGHDPAGLPRVYFHKMSDGWIEKYEDGTGR